MIFKNEKYRITYVYLSSLLLAVLIGVSVLDKSYYLAGLNVGLLCLLSLSMGEYIWSSK